MDEQELNGNVPESDIDELLNWWHQEEEPTADQEIDQEAVSADETVTEQEIAPKGKSDRRNKTGWQGTLLMYLHDLTYLLAGLILVFLLLFRVVVVSGTSMNNTLLDGDYLLLLSSTFYQNPQQGDVIVASKESFDNGAPIVKRVIATEGQVVDIDFDTGIVYVNGVALDEPYTLTPTDNEEGIQFPVKVPSGCLFVLGDNREQSLDSRDSMIGLVDTDEIVGRVVFRLYPFSAFGSVE